MAVPFMRAYTELLVRDVPPARRARDRRHGGVHPVAQGSRGERGRARQGARGQGARVARRLRRHVGRASRSRARRDRVLRRGARRAAEPARAAARRRRPRRGGAALDPRHAGRDHGAGAADERLGRDPLPRRVAARRRRGRDRQPDGGRGDRGDLAVAGVAVGARRPVHAEQVRARGGGGRGGRRGARSSSWGSRSRRNWSSSSPFLRTLIWSEPRQHQGRRHRARDRGGDRLRRARAGHGSPSGAVVGAVQRLAHAGARGAAAPGRARARLVRAESRRSRAHDLARRPARGVHGAGRARGRSRPRSPRRR